MYIVSWYDPEDPDDATSTGFVEFDDERKMLEWLNKEVVRRPKIVPRAFLCQGEVIIEPEMVTTRFRVSGVDWSQ